MKSVLAHVGTVRSEILVFSILGFILLNVFAAVASYMHPGDVMAAVMKASGILILFLGFVFYFYAFLHLPSSSQERIFTEQSVTEIARTRKAVHIAQGACDD